MVSTEMPIDEHLNGENEALFKEEVGQRQYDVSKDLAPVFAPPVLHDGLTFMRLGVQSVLKDEFTECFLRQSSEPFTAKTFISTLSYCLGFLVRYFILFPYRFLHLLSATVIFMALLPFIVKFRNQPWKSRLFTYYCRAFLYSWGSRIIYHGKKIRIDRPHVFVSNHTSFIDYIVLSAKSYVHSTVAQKHGGIIGWFETSILTLVGSVMFERTSKQERRSILEKMRGHIEDPKCAPLLIFPEGTCVNNDFTVLFHKGAFELGCVVYPVAIKYDKRWADAYWHTRTQSFTKHLFYLMTRWALIANVWFLAPREIMKGQTSQKFAAEVKDEISRVAGLKDLSWDGYFKNFPLLRDKQESLRASPQSIYVNSLLNRAKKKVFSGRDLYYDSESKFRQPKPKNRSTIATIYSGRNDELTSTRNKLLVEMSNICDFSVIESCSHSQAGLLSYFKSCSSGDSLTNSAKIRTDNISWRLWHKRRRLESLGILGILETGDYDGDESLSNARLESAYVEYPKASGREASTRSRVTLNV